MVKDHFKQIYSQEIKKLAIKHNITVKEVVDIYFKQFSFAVNQIREDNKKAIKDRSSIRLQGLGTINFHPTLAVKFQKINYDEIPRIEEASKNGNRNQLDQCND
jgi:hypothetical protein